MKPTVLFVATLLTIFQTAFAALIPIDGDPRTEVRLCPEASAALKTLLQDNPERTAGDVADTGSMKPLLDENYIVVVERRSFGNLKLGQIVLFRANWSTNIVAHRLKRRFTWGWQTKGDAFSKIDPNGVDGENYTGYVVIAAINKSTGQIKSID